MVNRKTWIEISIENIPGKANILGGRFVLSIMNHGTPKEIWKAIFVLQGHKGAHKNSQLHGITVPELQSVRIRVSLASTFGFKLFSTDVMEAYL